MFLKQKIFVQDDGLVELSTIQGDRSIRAVQFYMQVGGVVAHIGSMHPETVRRAGKALVSYAPTCCYDFLRSDAASSSENILGLVIVVDEIVL